MLRAAAFVLLATQASLDAQNLLRWNAWTQIASQWQRNYAVTTKQISFRPYCGTGCQNRPRTGIAQTVRITTAGRYQFRFRGIAGGSGTFRTELTLGTEIYKVHVDEWHVARTLSLPAGNFTITITTDTSNLLVDTWTCLQPELIPVLTPAVDVWVTDPGRPNQVRVLLSTKGNVLAASLAALPRPVPVPGFRHGLELDPSSLVILAISSRGDITVDLSRAAYNLGPRRWPLIHLQALDSKGFGSKSWF